MSKALNRMEVILKTSSPYCTQLSDRFERMIRTLTDKVQALIREGQLDSRYWGEALYQGVYLRNQTASIVLSFRAPHESLLGEVCSN